MLLILFLLGILAIARGVPCSVDGHYTPYCKKCSKERTCADIYHITYDKGAVGCSPTDQAVFNSMFNHLYRNRAYGMPNDDTTKISFCDQHDNKTIADDPSQTFGGHKPLMLFYQWGPSCNDGETFEMYPGGQSGFCYCGANCDKTYSNPPMNSLLTSLVVIIAANIIFNVVVLLYRYRDNRQQPKNTISTSVVPVARGVRAVRRGYP